MGVSLPALSTSSSEDNISLGDKDSVRRRALWALEGKPSADAFSPVEIPELNTPEIERRISELRTDIHFSLVSHPLIIQCSEQALVSSLYGQLQLRLEWPRQYARLFW
jgi:hypothetical protein